MNRSTPNADIYISHAPQDQSVADRLEAALRALGLKVGRQPSSARLTCVIWSHSAATSAHIQAECAQARKSGFVLPLQIDRSEVPHGIGTLQTLHLDEAAMDGSEDRLAVVRDEILRAVQGSRLWNSTTPRQRSRNKRTATDTAASLRSTPARFRRLWSAALGRAAAGVGALALVAWGALELQNHWSASHHRDAGVRLMLAAKPQPAEALRELSEAVRLRPHDALAHYHLAQLRVLLGHMDDARASITAALQARSGLSGTQRDMAQQLLARLNAPEPLPKLLLAEGRHDRTGIWAPDQPGLLQAARTVSGDPAELQDARALVQSLFDADPDQRLHAASLLAATPSATSDALPLALSKALALTRPGREADRAAVHALSATLHLALTASPFTLADQRKPLESLLAPINAERWGAHIAQQAEHLRTRLRQGAASPPVVRVVFADLHQRPWADHFVADLVHAGLVATAVHAPESAGPEHTQVRSMGSSHQGLARWLRKEAQLASQDPAVTVLSTRRGAEGRDEYEMWMGRDVCTALPAPQACRNH